jgi:hypothetical protein
LFWWGRGKAELFAYEKLREKRKNQWKEEKICLAATRKIPAFRILNIYILFSEFFSGRKCSFSAERF